MRTKEKRKIILSFGVHSCLRKDLKNIEILQNIHISNGMLKLVYKREPKWTLITIDEIQFSNA